jgi:lactate dehydrogenase-like 2-hydroxyacid dehydrogenase
MSSAVHPVLVAAEVETFLGARTVPGDVEVELLPAGAPVPEGDHVGILPILTRRIGAAELERLPRLRVVANMAVGYDNIDLDAARARGVAVSNTPDVLTRATAELTWALILAVARRVGEGERLVRAGAWTGWEPTQLLGTSLDGKLLGIVGGGRIGREVGRRAGAFGMDVAYWSRRGSVELERDAGARRVDDLLELAGQADVLSIHIASTPETRGIIDGAVLDRMPDGAILVNTARGDVVDEPALVERLVAGRIRAGLDVFAAEPGVPDALKELDNVVLLPHLGSATLETRQAMFDLAWENLLRGARGEPLLTPVP